jgi:hypothetical protein
MAAKLAAASAGSRPSAAGGGSATALACVSDMSDSSGGASPLCNLMEVKH